MRQVGEIYKGSKNPFTYKYVKTDEDGWTTTDKFLPRAYDLVYLKIEDRIKMGWYNGNSWDGYKIKPKDKPYYWKRKIEEDEMEERNTQYKGTT